MQIKLEFLDDKILSKYVIVSKDNIEHNKIKASKNLDHIYVYKSDKLHLFFGVDEDNTNENFDNVSLEVSFYEMGDVNQTFFINIADIITLVNYVYNDHEITQEQQFLADVNEDGEINVNDFVGIINIIKSFD